MCPARARITALAWIVQVLAVTGIGDAHAARWRAGGPLLEDEAARGADFEPWEDGLRTTTRRGAFEWWYFDAHLDDGSTVVVNLLTRPTSRWRGPLRPKLEVAVTEADGTTIREYSFTDPADFSASTEGCDVRMGDSRVWGDGHTYHLDIRGERIELDLELVGEIPPWRPGGGVAWFDEERTRYLGWVVPVPRGRVRGAVEVDGQRRRVQGTGYHDHNFGNLPLRRLLDYWLWGRASVGEWTVVFVSARGSRRVGHAPLDFRLVARGADVLATESGSLSVDLSGPSAPIPGPPSIPERVVLATADPDQAVRTTLALTSPRLTDRRTLVAELPQPVRWVAEAMVDAWYLRLDAEIDLRVEEEEEVWEARGRTVYEWMLFR